MITQNNKPEDDELEDNSENEELQFDTDDFLNDKGKFEFMQGYVEIERQKRLKKD